MTSGHGGDGWDAFDWESWGEVPGADGRNGTGGDYARPVAGGDERRTEPGDETEFAEERPADEGKWVSQGGVLRWETPGDVDEAEETSPRAEASSRWAADDVDLPPGAPDAIRIRAAHAWLLRQRALEAEAQGVLLLERRRLVGSDEEQDDEQANRRRGGPAEESPLDLALAKHQAAIDEYERLIEELDATAAHSGPARVLVEYHLYLTERLAELAMAPEAPAEFAERLLLVPVEDEEASGEAQRAPATPRAEAEWQGRAEAVLGARRRVEKVTAPDPED